MDSLVGDVITYSERVIPMVEKQCNTRCPRLLTVAEMA